MGMSMQDQGTIDYVVEVSKQHVWLKYVGGIIAAIVAGVVIELFRRRK